MLSFDPILIIQVLVFIYNIEIQLDKFEAIIKHYYLLLLVMWTAAPNW